jgi:hypothetical protein
MKLRDYRLLLFLFLSLSLFCTASLAFAEIHSTQDFTQVYYSVEGDKSKSFYPSNDASYLYEGSFDFTKEKLGDYEAYGNIQYRSTDDRLVDVEPLSIERMYFGLKGQAQEFLAGDSYSNFSEYSLGNALKGFKASFGDEKSSRLTLVAGIDTTKWEDLWETRTENSATRRYVWGSRLENDLLDKKLTLNFNYGGARDDRSYTSSSSTPALVNVFSADSKYIINNYFIASGEIAQSFTDLDTNSSAIKAKSDRAIKTALDFNSNDYTLSSVYSRVGNYFTTTGGFSAQDLETINFDGIWFTPWKMKLTHYLHTDRDNISNTKTTSTKQLNPGAKLSTSLPLGITWDIGNDLRKRYSSDKTTNEQTTTYSTNLARDFGIFYSTFGFSRAKVENQVSAAQERTADTYSLALDGNFKIKEVKLSWNVAEDVQHEDYVEAQKADLLTSTSLGLKLALPSTLAFEAKARLSDNDYYTNSSDSYITDYYLGISRELKKDLAFAFTYERKSYNYPDGDTNYAETIIKGKLSYKF